MAGVTAKSFDSPDETRTPEKTKVDVVDLGGLKAGRMTAQPGWTWEGCIKPIAKTDSCQNHHFGVCVGGRMSVTHNDGSQADIGPGDAYTIEPGHNAHVEGDEPFVAYEFDTAAAATFAKPS